MAQQHVLTNHPMANCRPQAQMWSKPNVEMKKGAPARPMEHGATTYTMIQPPLRRSRRGRESPIARLELPVSLLLWRLRSLSGAASVCS